MSVVEEGREKTFWRASAVHPPWARRDQRHGNERWLVERPRQPGQLIALAALAIIVREAEAVPEAGKSGHYA
jgi:hypothetical protein